MSVRYFALIGGIVYLLVGILGFIPSLVSELPPDAPDLAVEAMYGRLLGIFPINILHNLVHLAIGIWGVTAYRSFDGARTFSRALALIYGLLAIMGLLPVLRTTFGLVPIYGHDVWLHALTAIVAAYFGWMAAEDEDRVQTV